MTTTVTAKIQLRKGTAAQWTSANPTLLSGEIGYETDTGKQKIGDGSTAWTSLAYYHDPDLGGTYEAAGAVSTHAAVTSSVHGITVFGASLVDDTDAGTARTTLGLGTAATTAATDYAVAAKGVTNGDSHDHSGGDGAQISYSTLSNLPTLGTAAATDATAYATSAQGSTADTALQPGDDAADLGSGAATDNYVLTADGAGGAAWEAAAVTYAGAASEIHVATDKATPVDADELGLVDSAASWVLKKLTWANLKTTLSGVFALLAGKSGGQTLIGGTGVTDKLVLQGTSGNGTSTATALEVKVGNNGALTPLTVLNDGKVGINKSDPSVPFHVDAGSGELKFQNVSQSNLYVSGVNTTLTLDAISSNYPGLFLAIGGVLMSQLGVSSANASFVSRNKVLFSPNNNGFSETGLGCFAYNGFGYGTTSPAAWIHSLKTTEQLRLGYDASNYASFTVSSAGVLTLTTTANKIVLGASRTPASASDTGVAGEVCWDSSYLYVCVAANTWKRAALSTW